MTGKERMKRILRHEPVDRIGLYEHFGSDTHREWHEKGYLRKDESFNEHFQFDMQECWPFTTVADLDFKRRAVAGNRGHNHLFGRQRSHPPPA